MPFSLVHITHSLNTPGMIACLLQLSLTLLMTHNFSLDEYYDTVYLLLMAFLKGTAYGELGWTGVYKGRTYIDLRSIVVS